MTTTDFDTFLADAVETHRETVEFIFDEIDFEEFDTLPNVFVFTAPTGERCVISPFIIPNRLTVEVAMFDSEGHRLAKTILP